MNNEPQSRPPADDDRARTIDRVQHTLKRRYRAERRFRMYGMAAVVAGLVFVSFLFISIVSKGYTAFQQTNIELPVVLSAADWPTELPDGRTCEGGDGHDTQRGDGASAPDETA